MPMHSLGARLFAAIEGFENPFVLGFRNARAVVANADFHSVAKWRRRNADPFAARTVAHGIADQVAKNQFDGNRIAGHGRQVRGDGYFHMTTGLFDFLGHGRGSVLEQIADSNRLAAARPCPHAATRKTPAHSQSSTSVLRHCAESASRSVQSPPVPSPRLPPD